MIEMKRYEEADTDAIVELVLSCQNDGSRPLVTAEDQPEMLDIETYFFAPGGYFWVAKDDGRVIGTIGLMNYGNGIGILKKFFVYEKYRGKPCHLGQKLYAELLAFARELDFKKLILDTPKNTVRAHDFYEKAGFVKTEKENLPVRFEYPYENCDFFILNIS